MGSKISHVLPDCGETYAVSKVALKTIEANPMTAAKVISPSTDSNDKVSKRPKSDEIVMIICDHWFRTVQRNPSISIKDIAQLVIAHYSRKVYYDGRFVSEHCGRGIEVVNDDQIKFWADKPGGAYVSARLDSPILTESNSIVVWQIMMDSEKEISEDLMRLAWCPMNATILGMCDNYVRFCADFIQFCMLIYIQEMSLGWFERV